MPSGTIESAPGMPWTIGGLVTAMARRGAEPALLTVHESGHVETWSYGELAETAFSLAAGLRAAGIQSGEPVAIFAPNSPRWVACALALGVLGALAVPIDDLLPDAQAAAILEDSSARWVFASPTHLEMLRKGHDAQRLRICLLEPDAPSWRELLSEGPLSPPELPADQVACLFYTSGTTGAPKGFVLTQANIAANVEALSALGLVGPGDRALLPLPLHHAYPYIVGMLSLLQNGVAVVLPESVTGPHVVEALQKARVTLVIGVPRLYAALLDGIESRLASRGAELRCLFALALWAHRSLGLPLGRWLLAPLRRRIGPELRLLVSGGARLDAEITHKLEALGWEALSGYGLAETASLFSANLPGTKRAGSAGRPLGEGRVRIAEADETGVGEIELSGPNITAGYRDGQANREAFTPDGWFRSGDLGFVDPDGFLFITGRRKEALVLGGGKKVDPEDLEKAYRASPLIDEIALLEHDGRLVALVRPEAAALKRIGTMNARGAVRVALAEIGQTRAPYERVTGFEIARDPLPRTRLGKYRRFLLPEIYAGLASGTARPAKVALSAEERAELADPVAGRVWAVIQRRYSDKGPSLESHLALDLGIDSLEWMTLALELKAELGVALAPQDLGEIETVRTLIGAVQEAAAGRRAGTPTWRERAMADPERWLEPPGPWITLLGTLLFGLNKAVMGLVFRLRVDGLERLPESGPFVIAANHASDLDPLVVGAMLPARAFRRTWWAGDVVRLFATAPRRLFCRALRLYPVDERLPAAAIETAAKVLAKGNIQVWFPEAWRSPDGRLQRFLPGIAHLLDRQPVPVMPVYISGSFAAMPRTRHWPRPRPIRVVIGTPRIADELVALGSGESHEERLTSGLRAAVADLQP